MQFVFEESNDVLNVKLSPSLVTPDTLNVDLGLVETPEYEPEVINVTSLVPVTV